MICFEVAIILGCLVSLVMIVVAIANAVGGEEPCVHIHNMTDDTAERLLNMGSDRPRCFGIFPANPNDLDDWNIKMQTDLQQSNSGRKI